MPCSPVIFSEHFFLTWGFGRGEQCPAEQQLDADSEAVGRLDKLKRRPLGGCLSNDISVINRDGSGEIALTLSTLVAATSIGHRRLDRLDGWQRKVTGLHNAPSLRAQCAVVISCLLGRLSGNQVSTHIVSRNAFEQALIQRIRAYSLIANRSS